MNNGENSYSYYLEKFHEAKNNWIHTNNTNNLNKYLIEEENKLKNKINNKNYNTNTNNNTDTNSISNSNSKYWCCLYRK